MDSYQGQVVSIWKLFTIAIAEIQKDLFLYEDLFISGSFQIKKNIVK